MFAIMTIGSSYGGDILGTMLAPTNMRLLLLVTLLAIFAVWEARSGYWKLPAQAVRQSYATNLLTWLCNDVALTLLSVASLLTLAARNSVGGFLNAIPDPALRVFAALVLFDLTLYLWHRANHHFECLWRFHKVHHSDHHMNVTTAFRLHVVELALTMLVKAVFIFGTGVDTVTLVLCETFITANVMLHHANVTFGGETHLARIFMMPCLHRVHHSTQRAEHDNNYGALLSVWDRLTGTFAALEPKQIGLCNIAAQNVFELFTFGFRTAALPSPTLVMVAEAAYYRAEKRGFAPGNEMNDWLEAERELNLLLV